MGTSRKTSGRSGRARGPCQRRRIVEITGNGSCGRSTCPVSVGPSTWGKPSYAKPTKASQFERLRGYILFFQTSPAGTHVMSGRWVDTMKTPTMWRSKYTARGYEEPHSDEGCFAADKIKDIRMLLARCLDRRDQGHEAFVADCTQAFLNAAVREREQLYVQPPEGWTPKLLHDGRRVVWKVRKAMLDLRTSTETLAGTSVEQIDRTRFRTRRAPSLFVCEHGTGHLQWCACGRHAGCGSQ